MYVYKQSNHSVTESFSPFSSSSSIPLTWYIRALSSKLSSWSSSSAFFNLDWSNLSRLITFFDSEMVTLHRSSCRGTRVSTRWRRWQIQLDEQLNDLFRRPVFLIHTKFIYSDDFFLSILYRRLFRWPLFLDSLPSRLPSMESNTHRITWRVEIILDFPSSSPKRSMVWTTILGILPLLLLLMRRTSYLYLMDLSCDLLRIIHTIGSGHAAIVWLYLGYWILLRSKSMGAYCDSMMLLKSGKIWWQDSALRICQDLISSHNKSSLFIWALWIFLRTTPNSRRFGMSLMEQIVLKLVTIVNVIKLLTRRQSILRS